MITTLDTISWAKELQTGNGQFVRMADGTLYVVSNVRPDGSFVILKSDPVPPAPGPGSSFTTVHTYTFISSPPAVPNTDFDPVVVLDTTSGNPLLHIIGTQDHHDANPYWTDLVKFTYDTVTDTLTGPVVLTTGSTIRDGYDICVLDNGGYGGGVHHTMVAVSLNDPQTPALFVADITNINITDDELTVTTTADNGFSPGQLVTLSGLTTATFLNGAQVQVITSSPSTVSPPAPSIFTALYVHVNYPSASDTGTATPYFSGQSLIAFELDAFDAVVSGSIKVLANSPERSGNTVSSVSLLSSDGINVEVYYESHPKVITYTDQTFTIFLINRTGILSPPSSVWDTSPTTLTTFQGRYTDERLTVMLDPAGNRYLSQTFYTQIDHPEGLLANLLLGYFAAASSPPAWLFHTTFGSVSDGSILQASLSVSQTVGVYITYLLQPFDAVPTPLGYPAAYQFRVATVDLSTLSVTDVPGFYNALTFTWLRGTKSIIDDPSFWAAVGEREVLTSVVAEAHTIPAIEPFTVQVTNFDGFWADAGVSFTSPAHALVRVPSNPAAGQYAIEPSTGQYFFNKADAGKAVKISYSYISSILPVYVSFFNVPPVALLIPSSATVYRGAPLLLDASGSTDADQDPLLFTWTENDPDLTHIHLATSGGLATLTVDRAVGGASRAFNVGVAVIDLHADHITPRHDAIPVTNIEVDGANTLTVTAANSFVSLEKVMLYGVALAPPATPTFGAPVASGVSGTITNIAITGNLLTVTGVNNLVSGERVIFSGLTTATYLNTQVVQVLTATATQFTALFTHADDLSHSDTGTAVYPPPTTYYVKTTYINSVGETIASGEGSTSVAAGLFPVVQSPSASGDATAYNVYVSTSAAAEKKQNSVPIMLGTNWTLPLGGVILGSVIPAKNTAYLEFVNDIVFTVVTANPSSFTAVLSHPAFPSTPVDNLVSRVILQFQFATCDVTVPSNAAPTITFPIVPWTAVLSPPGPPYVTVDRNTKIEIIAVPPGTITHPLTQFPVTITGVSDVDDLPTYVWTQLTGTPVQIIGGRTSRNLTFLTNGVDVEGESLTLSLTVSDGVNPSVTELCTVIVVPYDFAVLDTLKISRSNWYEQDTITGVSVSSKLLTVNAANNFISGQLVSFSGVTTLAILNGKQVTVVSASATQFTADFDYFDYPFAPDTGLAAAIARISQRNEAHVWGTLDVSGLYTNFAAVKRTSVLDGTDRYIVISPVSVLVYGIIDPNTVLLHKLLTPQVTAIVDAVHTEDDYTLVLDAGKKLYRYTNVPLINSDNPDATLDLNTLSSQRFNRIFATYSFANIRILALSGPDGAMLVQLTNDELIVQGTLQLTTTSNFVAGADNIQFVRLSNVENLHSGKILLGTVAHATFPIDYAAVLDNAVYVVGPNTLLQGDRVFISDLTHATFLNGLTLSALIVKNTGYISSLEHADYGYAVTNVSISGNVLTVTANNALSPTDHVALLGLTDASFLNGVPLVVTTASPTQFTAPLTHDPLASTPTSGAVCLADVGTTTALTEGSTYETLIDLPHGQIIGTWDASKLRNQFVNTGEILFEVNSAYSGRPIPPVQAAPTVNITPQGKTVTIVWTQERPDLITAYNVEYAFQTTVSATVPVSSLTVTIPSATLSTDIGIIDVSGITAITNVAVASGVLTITANNNLSAGAVVIFANMARATFLNGQTVTVTSANSTQFTANLVHSDYPSAPAWSSVTPYFFNDTVERFGVFYAAVLSSTGLDPAIDYPLNPGVNWELLTDFGTATSTINQLMTAIPTNVSPGPGQYSVSSGIYTFNAAQANHTVAITFRSQFQILQRVSSGVVERLTIALPGGAYAFRIQAFSLDGASGYSNIQVVVV